MYCLCTCACPALRAAQNALAGRSLSTPEEDDVCNSNTKKVNI